MGLEKDSQNVGIGNYFAAPKSNFNSFVEYFSKPQELESSTSMQGLSKYLNEKAISDMIRVNTEIENILGAFKIPVKINLKILKNLLRNHLPHTRKIALGIAKYLSKKRRQEVNYNALCKATVLHDLAKVIIPENIINKRGALNPDEKEIMEKHADLSYELLKNTDLDEDTLYLIKNHHHDEDACPNINLQILSMADIYSALREERSYKKSLSREESLSIIKKQVEEGKFEHEVYEALAKYAQNESRKFKFNWKIFELKFVNSFGS